MTPESHQPQPHEFTEPSADALACDAARRAVASLAEEITGHGAPADADADGNDIGSAEGTSESWTRATEPPPNHREPADESPGGPSARAGEAGDGELESVLKAVADGETSPTRLAMDPEGVRRGLGRLVLVVVRLLHELMEREGLRRVDIGSLSDEEIERLGLTLMRQAEEIDRLREHFGLEPEDMQLDLGPLGRVF